MSTPLIKIQLPCAAIRDYDPYKRPWAQHETIPRLFNDAVRIRDAVFVKEQGVDPVREVDMDDARCVHLVAYAQKSVQIGEVGEKTLDLGRSSGAHESNLQPGPLPIATIRIVPFPHPSHMRSTTDHASECYIKLGRLAVVKECRGRSIGKSMVEAALQWLCAYPTYFDRPLSETGILVDQGRGHGQQLEWQGLICVHAQRGLQTWWASQLAFVVDESMGTWMEEGIEHVGMWRRLPLLAAEGR